MTIDCISTRHGYHRLNCSNSVPSGTVAHYGCRNYYKAEAKLYYNMHRMIQCDSGVWKKYKEFDDFRCVHGKLFLFISFYVCEFYYVPACMYNLMSTSNAINFSVLKISVTRWCKQRFSFQVSKQFFVHTNLFKQKIVLYLTFNPSTSNSN